MRNIGAAPNMIVENDDDSGSRKLSRFCSDAAFWMNKHCFQEHEFFDQNADLQSTQKFEDTNITLVILHLFPIINKLDENNTMIKKIQ